MGCSQSSAKRFEAATQYEKARFRKRVYVGTVYDGDTFTVLCRMDGVDVKRKCRLKGVDTPEMKPALSLKGREDHIRRAKLAKAFVESQILKKHVWLHVEGCDKYGRWLVTVGDLSAQLIQRGHGYAYDGGTKEQP